MKTVLALIVAATLGMSSIAFAADTVAPAAAPMATAPAAHSAPAKNMHHKKATKSVKKADKAAPMQKAQAAKKHHKKTTHTKSAPAAVPAAK
ncbi:acid resistance repetitive basic protein Asr [Yersinia enterocolitica]|uniref:acid resistance repetitive basic protein Asr n=1 Tax=Yersinia enterocolitica TaxID=630 RepID=UPI0005DC2E92|nr:acid resistance repetitive basic protein Asr [Yersinia enterocolitica]EKN3458110.1 acid resistance repetitive basic protein Asr [Yersinia enterocolitica]EKN3498045.1 acid resistance repetitive basic protein Asr [Yersinia enterocolitica]EKN3569110.1 acid resistance repetitive basic protein Asr [Yersinia enterocolitica]EKN3683852.1 acid resistance repetitive basic protein Asr [Yersinia enterocolitica]EKN3723992.1 acid resistance repetitive basic protein Asr [Yersinia enterocolitica]